MTDLKTFVSALATVTFGGALLVGEFVIGFHWFGFIGGLVSLSLTPFVILFLALVAGLFTTHENTR